MASTKEKILDASEYLFARNGYHSTSLRQITGRARVNLASVNYHFGSKKSLITEVIERRLLPLNEIRMERLLGLEVIQDKGGKARVGDIIRAFVEPTIFFRKSATGSEDFIVLVGRILSETDETARNIFIDLMRPVFNLLSELLGEALPNIPKDILFCRLVFTLGAMGHALNAIGKCGKMAEGLETVYDAETMTNTLVAYLAGGMEAPL